jgi:acetyltransferase-like isoleucine patch superfamily enzyme
MDDPRIVELRQMGARIGEGVFLGADVYIERDFAPLLTIEDGVVLARGVSILLHDSALNNVAGAPIKFGRVTLRSHCYIGANATVLCGVEIGARAVIGACALVTRDVPPEAVAYGQPARLSGTIADLMARQSRERGVSPAIGYLPLTPWRDRRDPDAARDAERLIGEFVRHLAYDQR